ncbi:MAG: ABC transporter permease [Acidobacteriota bacterium]
MNPYQDFRYALRRLRQEPGTTAAVILVLGLGLGMTTAVWSLIDASMLRPLPYKNAEDIVVIQEYDIAGEQTDYLSGPTYRDLRDAVDGSVTLAAKYFESRLLTEANNPDQLRGHGVTDGFLDTLGIRLEIGRPFTTEEHKAQEKVVILQYDLWQRQFGGDPAILGETIVLSSERFEVVGVMAEGAAFPTFSEYYRPFDAEIATDRMARSFQVIGRRAPGVSVDAARERMTAVFAQLEREHPEALAERTVSVESLRVTLMGKDAQTRLFLLLAAVGALLAVTCLNVAALLLARSNERRHELAIRRALGAGKGRVHTQLITESLTLALLGGAVGILLAYWLVDLITALLGDALPSPSPPVVDLRVLAVTFLIAVVSGTLFGLLPARQAGRLDIVEALKPGRHGQAGGRRIGSRAALVVAQIAFSAVLVVAAALMARTLFWLDKVELGFDPEPVFNVGFVLSGDRYDATQKQLFWDQLLERLESTEGIAAAGGANFPPFTGSRDSQVEVPGTDLSFTAGERVVLPGTFETLSRPLLAGRDFDERDETAAARVIIVTESFAQRIAADGDALGRTIRIFDGSDSMLADIVGVVGDVRHSGPTGPIRPEFFHPFDQDSWGYMNLLVRSEGNRPETLEKTITSVINQIDPELPTFARYRAGDRIDDYLLQPQISALTVVLFATCALLLAAIGVYGVLAHTTFRRTREIGIRMALGAESAQVLRAIIADGMKLVATGLMIGLAASLLLTLGLENLLWGVSVLDPISWASAVLALTGAGLLAAWLPARRASRVHPAIALRNE